MIVETLEQLQAMSDRLSEEPYVSFDVETTGLRRWHNDRIFSIVFAVQNESWYINFQNYQTDKVKVWDFASVIPYLLPVLRGGLRFAHNSKFDLAFLLKEGIEVGSEIHDTEVMARLLYNQHQSYSLDNCCARDLDKRKDDRVMNYILEHNLWRWEKRPGKSTPDKLLFFNEVPFEIISEYAQTDAVLTYELGMYQINEILKIAKAQKESAPGSPTLHDVYEQEKGLTKVCLDMEATGVLVDLKYCEEAIRYEEARITKYEAEFLEAVKPVQNLSFFDREFIDSGKELGPIFESLGFKPGLTEDGSPKVDDVFLESVDHPAARALQGHRDASKRCNTYFRSFLYYADTNKVIHPDMRQGGTATGRFSYRDPNLQNVSKDSEDSTPFPIRRAFVPRPGYFFVMIDFKAMEFCLMLDYANEKGLIEKIKAGHDPHQSTADLTGLTRSQAKTLNFGILYGMGIKRLGKSLRVSDREAKRFKASYFDALPSVEHLIFKVTKTVKDRGFLFNWKGRRFHFSDPKYAYKGINHLIQGGSADIVRQAMLRLHTVLPEFGARMLLQIHDEILFEFPLDCDDSDVFEVKRIMESVYEAKHLPLTCTVSSSLKSWGDAETGLIGKEVRNKVQGALHRGASVHSECLVREGAADSAQGDA